MLTFGGMKITLQNISKRYNTQWIFRNVNFEFSAENPCVILGANGSGKSTLLQLISGTISPSGGKIEYSTNGHHIEIENIFRQLSFAAPYLELIEEYTLEEMLKFHVAFKSFFENLSIEKIIEILRLENAKNKPLKNFSSGMKQRVKLGLAILSNTPLLLLDEPCSNLDKSGIEWYQSLIEQYRKNRLVIVCSNQQQHEHAFCTQPLNIENFKN